ncbi:cell adhesion domain-containing protein [Bdellovibrio bacteriovorus]|uniref:Peptidase C39-like domain-containing protein n=1 Tax=Bdellovibrio bacteriovorus str. Tiberius TaxID=1069642 RepID=K7YS54_BDEBC|nr:cell adhesion domain-containing protein [Bdellovibrio bacteriovorus]AFY02736.1 hypothetical protein containing a CARDB (cell adhesion related) domain [Bdellovibrio bacteriovorus str. Tiberius]
MKLLKVLSLVIASLGFVANASDHVYVIDNPSVGAGSLFYNYSDPVLFNNPYQAANTDNPAYNFQQIHRYVGSDLSIKTTIKKCISTTYTDPYVYTNCEGVENRTGATEVLIDVGGVQRLRATFRLMVPKASLYEVLNPPPAYIPANAFTVYVEGTIENPNCTVSIGQLLPPTPLQKEREQYFEYIAPVADSEKLETLVVDCEKPYRTIHFYGNNTHDKKRHNFILAESLTLFEKSVVPSDVDFAVGMPQIPLASMEADAKPGINLADEVEVKVTASASGISANDSRSVTVALDYGVGTKYESVPASRFANGANVEIPFRIKYQFSQRGLRVLKATINGDGLVPEVNLSNNQSLGELHVLCKAKELPRRFVQKDPKWGGDQYANQPKRMSALGCMTTSLAMLYQYYGIEKTVLGEDLDPGSVNKGFKSPTFWSGTVSEFQGFGAYDASGGVIIHGAVNYGRRSAKKTCELNGGEANECSVNSLKSFDFSRALNFIPEGLSDDLDRELCEGNPFVLKVPSIREPHLATKAHFVVASKMAVDETGKYGYSVADPAVRSDDGTFYGISQVRGARIYKTSLADVARNAGKGSIEIRFIGDLDVTITSPGGHKAVYTTDGSQSNAIPGSYFLEPEEIGDAEDVSSGSASMTFLSQAAENGVYRVEISGSDDTEYSVVRLGFDENGEINAVNSANGSLEKGQRERIDFSQSADPYLDPELPEPQPEKYKLDISRADLYSLYFKKALVIKGKMTGSSNRPIENVMDRISIQIDRLKYSFKRSSFVKYRVRNGYRYSYVSLKNGLAIHYNTSDGDFDFYFTGKNFYSGKATISVGIDGKIAERDVLIRRK